jgi:hypothetical protein
MRYNEFVNEAINTVHLERPIKLAIKSGIARAIGNLYSLKGKHEAEEAEFDEGFTNGLFEEFKKVLLEPNNMEGMGWSISKEVVEVLNKETRVAYKFADTKDAEGTAQDIFIEISDKFVPRLTKRILDNLQNIILDNYGEYELIDGLWFVLRSIGAKDREYMYSLYNDAEKTIDQIATTTIHELVHVTQHNRQNEIGRHEHEYRSYLDKKKGEFANLHNNRHDGDTSSNADDDRYDKLYRASPQEIAAFSHQIALKIVKDFNVTDATDPEDLKYMASAISAESIIDYVTDEVGRYYRKPENRREYAVFKRYVKMVYSEIQAYLAKRKEYLSKTLNERAIGKKMGHDLYVHKDYVAQTPIPRDALKAAISKLPKDYDYTAVKYNKADGSFSFIQSPDFDTADEPTVGVSLKVSADGNVKRTNPPSDPWIWHNKWMWVGDDYSGFDVEKAKARGKQWKDVIGVDKAVSSRIGKKSYWDTNIVPRLK